MKLYFAFATAQKTQRKISVRIKYAPMVSGGAAQTTPWAVICSIYFFFFLLNYQVKIQLFLMVLIVCFSIQGMRKGLLSICSN